MHAKSYRENLPTIELLSRMCDPFLVPVNFSRLAIEEIQFLALNNPLCWKPIGYKWNIWYWLSSLFGSLVGSCLFIRWWIILTKHIRNHAKFQ